MRGKRGAKAAAVATLGTHALRTSRGCRRLDDAHMRSESHLILSPPKWRDVLRDELIATGFDHDAAGVIARRVIECLVRDYLAGDGAVTRRLDEAA